MWPLTQCWMATDKVDLPSKKKLARILESVCTYCTHLYWTCHSFVPTTFSSLFFFLMHQAVALYLLCRCRPFCRLPLGDRFYPVTLSILCGREGKFPTIFGPWRHFSMTFIVSAIKLSMFMCACLLDFLFHQQFQYSVHFKYIEG